MNGDFNQSSICDSANGLIASTENSRSVSNVTHSNTSGSNTAFNQATDSQNGLLMHIEKLFSSLKEQIHTEMSNKYVNDFRLINEKINQLSFNNTPQTNQSGNLTFNDVGISETVGLQLERCISKKLRLANHINIIKSHISNKTTPSSLFYCRFPRPFFWDDEEYVKMHNERISKWQIEAMNQDIDYLNKKINEIDLEINVLSQNANDFSKSKSVVIKTIESEVEKSLKPIFDKSSEKINRIVAKPYVVRSKLSNQNQDNQFGSSSANGSFNSQASSSNSTSNLSRTSKRDSKRTRYDNTGRAYGNGKPNKRPRGQPASSNSRRPNNSYSKSGFRSVFKNTGETRVRFSQSADVSNQSLAQSNDNINTQQ